MAPALQSPAMTSGQSRRARSLAELAPRLLHNEGFVSVVESLRQGNSGAIDGAWGSACALTVAGLAGQATSALVVVLPRLRDVDEFADDVAGFLGHRPLVFPAWETLPDEHDVSDAVFGGRLRVLNTLRSGTDTDADSGPRTIVTSLPALMQPVPNGHAIDSATRHLTVGEELDTEEFLRWLVERGFARITAIETAWRILDARRNSRCLAAGCRGSDPRRAVRG